MKKLIILLLCCGVLMSMVGCGGKTAPPSMGSPPTMASETVITDTPTETTPHTTAVEPTEKEKEAVQTESTDQATKPTVTATEPTITAKPTEETKPTATHKPTESSADAPKENGCITIVETDTVAQKIAEYINQFRIDQGDVTATVIPGLTEYCKYRCTQLKTNFAHDTTDQRAAAKPYNTVNMLTGHYMVSKARKIIILPMCAKPSAKAIGAVRLTR